MVTHHYIFTLKTYTFIINLKLCNVKLIDSQIEFEKYLSAILKYSF